MENQAHLDSLNEIKDLMNKSTKFISLSGLSGIYIGIIATIGGISAYLKLENNRIFDHDLIRFLLFDAGVVLLLSLLVGFYFTNKKAKKNGVPVFDISSKNMLLSMLFPLLTGGVVCLILIMKGDFIYVSSLTLIFYGLALVSGSKFTLSDVKFLGFMEILLGLISMLMVGYGIYFWILGFGFLHILYGIVMYLKYDKLK